MRTSVIKSNRDKKSVFKTDRERNKPKHRHPITKEEVKVDEFDPMTSKTRSIRDAEK